VKRLAGIVALLFAAGTGGGCAVDRPVVDAAAGSCAPFVAYLGHPATTVTVSSSIRDVQADRLKASWEHFQQCTGISIAFEGSAAFEADLKRAVQRGAPPDMSFFPQPGLLADLARSKALQPASPQVTANVDRWWSADWKRYGTVDGRLYAAPLTANVKSLVWYSPAMFAEHHYTIPTSWNELIALSDRMVGDGVKPWCVGLESGKATGWPATDWLEDFVLRESGTEVYDAWVEHRIPFNDPRIESALDRVGKVLRNPAYVNGGLGGAATVVSTSFQEAGLPIIEGKCGMHRQASFYSGNWPAGARVARDGDVFAFDLPPLAKTDGRRILGAGEFVGVFHNRPEVDAFAAYLSTPQWVNELARIGGAVSANKGFDVAHAGTPIERLSAELLTDPDVVFRFDASDMMPASVGTDTFWTGMIDWVNGADTSTVLKKIEVTWPR
jgi:alpha-glucoside transport system substrate-binding protein